ncbi:protein kinase domain-containing protein [Nocardia sp. FBN12]|uniref:serine/threonine-protein kinase n=1 Tax=Nocardia sp. FBN12 TaxID=3419766 RepID=UPI003D08C084
MAGGAMAGSMFGRYEIRRLLGVGGMGEVYEAYDTSKNRVVALKMLNRELAGDPTFVQRFRRESQAMASVQEPHVIPVHDWGEVDGVLYIDMRLVKGVDLRERLQQHGRLTPVEAVQVVEQIAFALDAAHEVGLVHRDVKPGNILLTGNLFAYLVDFGIAHTATDPQLTSAGSAVGSMAYMAPERFESVPMSPSVDTYALTCVLYECLVGRVPFPVNSLAGAIGSHQMAPAPRPSAADSTLATFDAVIERGMAKRPEQRYGTPVDLARAAKAALIQAERSTPATVAGARVEITGPQTPPPAPEDAPSPPTTRGSAVVPSDPPPTRDSAALPRDAPATSDSAALSPDSYAPPTRDSAALSRDTHSPPTRDSAALSPDSHAPATRNSAALSRDSHSPPTRNVAALSPDSHSPATRASGALSAGPKSPPQTRGLASQPARQPTEARPFGPTPQVAGSQAAERYSTRRGTGPEPTRRVTGPQPGRAAEYEVTALRASQRVVGPGSGYTHPSAPIPVPQQRNSATPVLVGALGSLIVLAAVGIGVWIMMSVDDSREGAVPAPPPSGVVEPSVIDTQSQTYASPAPTTVPPLQSSVSGAEPGLPDGGSTLQRQRCRDVDRPHHSIASRHLPHRRSALLLQGCARQRRRRNRNRRSGAHRRRRVHRDQPERRHPVPTRRVRAHDHEGRFGARRRAGHRVRLSLIPRPGYVRG